MELKNQVVSLELARQLKEAGVPQNSYWSICSCHERIIQSFAVEEYEDKYSAFTVAELGEMLPASAATHYNLNCMKIHGKWNCGYYYFIYLSNRHAGRGIGDGMGWMYMESAETEADARAKMLLFLIRSNLINPSSFKGDK